MNVQNRARPYPQPSQLSTEPQATRNKSSSVSYPGPLTWVANILQLHCIITRSVDLGCYQFTVRLQPLVHCPHSNEHQSARHLPKIHSTVNGRTHRTPVRSSRRAKNQKMCRLQRHRACQFSWARVAQQLHMPLFLSVTCSRKITSIKSQFDRPLHAQSSMQRSHRCQHSCPVQSLLRHHSHAAQQHVTPLPGP